MSNPLLHLAAAGQSVWLDYIHRRILENGELQRLIDRDGVMGLTSNPSIFEQSIGQGTDYDDRLRGLLDEGVAAPAELYERLAISDVRTAADQLRPAYDWQEHRDGYVSLEVSPHLAMDTVATVAEARRLWRTVDRPNLMIKVPGTGPGAEAVRQLIGEGININVTLLFGIEAYLAAAEAHMQGLEDLRARGGHVSEVHGVASFFISRIDTEIDASIDRRLQVGAGAHSAELTNLRGKVAIANAKIAYQRYQEVIDTARWQALADAGAMPQRLLWASIGVKDRAYSDVHYVEALIGPDTVVTMPAKTLEAFRSRGHVSPSLTERLSEARDVLALADRLGLDLEGVTNALVIKGVRQFADAFDGLMDVLADKRTRILGGGSAEPSSKAGRGPPASP